jgi:hypothetical protein
MNWNSWYRDFFLVRNRNSCYVFTHFVRRTVVANDFTSKCVSVNSGFIGFPHLAGSPVFLSSAP